MIIAIDFDETIVNSETMVSEQLSASNGGYDFKILGLQENAKEVIKWLYTEGHTLILWTCRNGHYLHEARLWLNNNNMEEYFETFNQQCKEVMLHRYWSCFNTRKVYADIYIDDKNIGGFPGWLYVKKYIQDHNKSNQ